MKKFLLLLFLFHAAFSVNQAQTLELPDECKEILDKNYQGWKFAKVRDDIIDYFRRENLPYQLNLIKGDWNGDGKTDFAALVEHGKLKNYQGDITGNERFTIAFVRVRDGYRHFVLDNGGGDYITLMKKGAKDYNYETDKNFQYKTDAIFDGYFEKGGVSYVWKNKKFRMIATSD